MLVNIAFSVTLHVPDDYQTIQAAINASEDGDEVLVAAGTYSGEGNRLIEFYGKNIALTSTAGADQTIIDCGNVNNINGFFI